LRQQIVTAMWGRDLTSGLAGSWTVDRWLRPLWWAFHTICVFGALGSRRISWAGVDYIVRSPQDIDVIRRSEDRSATDQPSFRSVAVTAAPSYKQEPEQT
jgi:hypothetical protein